MYITYPPTYHLQVAKRKMEMLFVRGDGVILVCLMRQLSSLLVTLMCMSNRCLRRLEHSKTKVPKVVFEQAWAYFVKQPTSCQCLFRQSLLDSGTLVGIHSLSGLGKSLGIFFPQHGWLFDVYTQYKDRFVSISNDIIAGQ